jgi:hypothetical protein
VSSWQGPATSYAAGLIGSAEIEDNSIRSKDIRSGAVQGSDVRDGSLARKDFRPGSLPAGARGPAGPQGPPGVGRWVLVNAAGQIEAQSGGFSVTAAYPTLAATEADPLGRRANGNVYINAGEPLGNNGIVASIALQNTSDQNADMITNGRSDNPDANPEFSGEIAVSQCIAGLVNCAPPGTANPNTFVVSPRLSDGRFTTDDTRKRFYVIITGDSADMAP